MTPEELATKHFPYNTTCPMKRKKIDWQREQLAKEINAHFSPVVSNIPDEMIQLAIESAVNSNAVSLTYENNKIKVVYTPKPELK